MSFLCRDLAVLVCAHVNVTCQEATCMLWLKTWCKQRCFGFESNWTAALRVRITLCKRVLRPETSAVQLSCKVSASLTEGSAFSL